MMLRLAALMSNATVLPRRENNLLLVGLSAARRLWERKNEAGRNGEEGSVARNSSNSSAARLGLFSIQNLDYSRVERL